MREEKDICSMVDEDILHAEAVWKASSYDCEVLERLFHRLLEHYRNRIEGFSKGLQVVQSYETSAKLAEIYRNNIALMMERLYDFRENDYSNEGLLDYYIQKDWQELQPNADFTTVRLELGEMQLSSAELEDIMEHLDAMERICAKVATQKEKWEGLRAHLVWLSGKDVRIMVKILPLFSKIS